MDHFRYVDHFRFQNLYSGKDWHEKIKDVRGTLTKKKADALVVTALDEVACKEIYLHKLPTSNRHYK